MRPASRCAAAGKRVPSWIARCIHACFPWRFGRSVCPACGDQTRPRRPLRLELEPFDPRESPTSLLFSSSLTASLLAMHPPVSSPPALAETQTSFVPISIAAEASAVRGSSVVRGSPDPAPANVSDRSPAANDHSVAAQGGPAGSSRGIWDACCSSADFFGDDFALDPSPGAKPHSGGSFSGSAFEDAHLHSSSSDGGGTTGGGGGSSSGGAGAFFGAGSMGEGIPESALGGLASSGTSGASNASRAPVANAPGSESGAPSLPTNILL